MSPTKPQNNSPKGPRTPNKPPKDVSSSSSSCGGQNSQISSEIQEWMNYQLKQLETRMEATFKDKLDNIILEYQEKLDKLEEKYETLLDVKVSTIIQANAATIVENTKDLRESIADLTLSGNFMSEETSKLKESIAKTKNDTKENLTRIDYLKERANNSEDQSRRSNLLFFDIPEVEGAYETNEDCYRKVEKIAREVLGTQDVIHIDRSHRLGRKKDKILIRDPETGIERSAKPRPRPIIARFTSYPVKELIVEYLRTRGDSGPKFAISEDYCKATQEVRKLLLAKLKEAKNLNKDMIKGGFVKYKTLVLKFGVGDRNIYCNYTLDEISNNPNWYMKPKAPTVSE